MSPTRSIPGAHLTSGRSVAIKVNPALGLLGPTLIFYVVLLATPFFALVTVGFLSTSQTGLFDPIPTLQNYASIFFEAFHHRIIWTTLRLSVETTFICLVLGYPVAYWLATTSTKVRKWLLVTLLFPLLLSTIIRVYGWIALLGRQGLVNQLLLDFGFIERPLGLMYHEWTVALGLVSILIPYTIINITNTLVTIDPAYKEAAAIHGASPWKTFLNVTLPLSRPGIVSACLIVFSISMSTYLISLLLGGPRVKLMGNVVYDSISSFNWPLGAALSVILVFLTLMACYAFISILSTEKQRA